MAVAVEDHDFAVQRVTGELDELAEQITPPYAPDGVGDDPEMLAAALYIQATRLVRIVRLQDFRGDDVREAFQRVVGSRPRLDPSYMGTRLKTPGTPTVGSVNSETEEGVDEEEIGDATILDWLIARVGVDLAVQDGEYQEAFRFLGQFLVISVLELGDEPFTDLIYEVPDNKRWEIDEILEKALDTEGWVSQLDRKSKIDWGSIQVTCENVLFTAYSYLHQEAHTLMGWIENQISVDDRRRMYEEKEDASAERRLRSYFFTDTLWELLPKDAKRALISADRAFVDSTSGRREAFLNELRVATEEVLYHRFWKPLGEWSKKQPGYPTDPDFRATSNIRGHLGKKRPSLDNYEKEVLPDIGTRRFLREIGLNEESLDFKSYIERLRKTRNIAEHTTDRKEVDALYAEALGIGQRGVLPELVRLLSKRTS